MKKGILINDTSGEQHIGSYVVINNIINLCKKNNIFLKYKVTRRDLIEISDEVENFINECDIIIVNGEGTLHRSPKFFNKLEKFLPLDKPCVLINSLWDKMYHHNLSKYLDKFSLISLRESFSYDALLSVYPKKNKILLVPDVIFYLNSKQEKIGYGDSVMEGFKLSLKTKRNYYPLNFIDNIPSIDSYITWLKSLDLYITGRFHGVCLSAITGTPFLVFPSNSHKIEGILRDMKCSNLLIQSFNEINSKTIRAKELITNANAYAKEAKSKIEILFNKIGKLL